MLQYLVEVAQDALGAVSSVVPLAVLIVHEVETDEAVQVGLELANHSV